MSAGAVAESGGTRVVRRMLFDAENSEPAASISRRLSLPAVPLNSAAAAADGGRWHKTPTKCNYHKIAFEVNCFLVLTYGMNLHLSLAFLNYVESVL